MQGKYPKDFKFTGWHPHCRCYVTSILKTDKEIAADNERIMAGLEPLEGSENTVSDVPDAFKEWVDKNEERISKAKSLPYFLQDNGVRTADGTYTLNRDNTTFGKDVNTNIQRQETPILNRHDEERPYMVESLGITDEEAQEFVGDITMFTGNGYMKMREFQQGKYMGDLNEYFAEKCASLDKFIDLAPKWDGLSYRGINVDKKTLDEFIRCSNEGGVISMKGTSSWSADEMTSKYFAAGDEKRVVFRCNGIQYGTSIRAYSRNVNEHEILVSSKARWRIVGYKVIHGFHYFDVVLK